MKRPEAQMRQQLLRAEQLLNDPDKDLNGNQILFLSGTCQTLRWILMDPETEAPTVGF